MSPLSALLVLCDLVLHESIAVASIESFIRSLSVGARCLYDGKWPDSGILCWMYAEIFGVHKSADMRYPPGTPVTRPHWDLTSTNKPLPSDMYVHAQCETSETDEASMKISWASMELVVAVPM